TPGFLTAAVHTAPINASSIDVTANRAYSANLGFEMGGPIVKGKAWWYFGAAPNMERTDYTRITKRQTDCRKQNDDGSKTNCEKQYSDGSPDLDPKTGFYITDELDRDVRAATSKSTTILAKVSAAPFEDHQVQLSSIILPASSETPGLYGLPTSGR